MKRLGFERVTPRPDERWIDADGAPVTDAATLQRIRALAIPPAWTNVWAAADATDPVQATGADARGRTQYRYSASASALAANLKFEHMIEFARALPRLRAQVSVEISDAQTRDSLEHDHVVATLIRLLDRGLFRVGNERYAHDNHTYGLTTIRRAQLSMNDDIAVFDFVGKEHLAHHIEVPDPVSAPVLRALLSRWPDPESAVFAVEHVGAQKPIASTDVNRYIHAHTGTPATAKVFRTWGATAAAAAVVAGAHFGDARDTRQTEKAAVEAAAALLGDTVTVTRGSYVHPRAIAVGRTPRVVSAVDAASERLGSRDVHLVFSDPELQAAVLDELTSDTVAD